jgi:hypothetical protein
LIAQTKVFQKNDKIKEYIIVSHKHKDFVAINDDFQNGMAV